MLLLIGGCLLLLFKTVICRQRQAGSTERQQWHSEFNSTGSVSHKPRRGRHTDTWESNTAEQMIRWLCELTDCWFSFCSWKSTNKGAVLTLVSHRWAAQTLFRDPLTDPKQTHWYYPARLSLVLAAEGTNQRLWWRWRQSEKYFRLSEKKYLAYPKIEAGVK